MPRKKSYEDGPNPFGVQAGQIWENCDKRFQGKRVAIVMVREEHGYAVVQKPNGHMGRIKLDRFRDRSNGYRLVVSV